MSSDIVLPETPQSLVTTKTKDKSKKKDKNRPEKKSSKKRRREEEDDPVETSTKDREESPSKRARTVSSINATWLSSAIEHNGSHTPLHEQTATFYLALSPVSLRHPLKGLCAEHLSRLILTYYPPLNGIVLCYRNVKLSSQPPTSTTTIDSSHHEQTPALAQQIDEYASSFVWLTASFLVLRLEKGIWLDAVVNIQNESHLGLLVWNLFSASIPRERLPKDWRWREATPTASLKSNSGTDGWGSDEHGYFVDGAGKRLPQQISFRVRDYEAAPATEGDRGFISVGGTLLDDKAEQALERTERETETVRSNKRRQGDRRQVQEARLSFRDAVVAEEAQSRSQTPNGTGESGKRGRHRAT